MKSRSKGRNPGVELAAAQEAQAFTRLELAAVLAMLGLLTLLALPTLANQRERSTRVLCVNNLRLVGQGLEQWGTEHGGRLPWRTAWCEGGTMGNFSGASCLGSPPSWLTAGFQNNCWFQWSWISNEVRSPKVLACPSDAQKIQASQWAYSSSGGFLHPYYQNKAVSYLVGLDVFPEHPDGLVAADRNLRFTFIGGSCSTGISPVSGLSVGRTGSFGIGGAIHVEAGNFLFADGRVEELSSRAFVGRALAIFGGQNDNGSAHYLTP